MVAHIALERGDERLRSLPPDRAPHLGRHAVDCALDGEQFVDAAHDLDGDRRLGELRQVEEVAPPVRPACVRVSPGKEDGCDLKPFKATQRVRRPPGKGGARQPEASLARAAATAFVKRRQRALKPCGSLEIMKAPKPSPCWVRGQHRSRRHGQPRPIRPGSQSRAKAREGSPGNLRGPVVARTEKPGTLERSSPTPTAPRPSRPPARCSAPTRLPPIRNSSRISCPLRHACSLAHAPAAATA